MASLLLWQLAATFRLHLWLSFEALPGPITVFGVLARELSTPTFYQDVGASLERIAVGFVLAGVCGAAIGIGVARSRSIDDTVGTLVEILRPVPAIALVPIALLMLPTNEQGIITITFLAALFPVVVSTQHAVRSLPLSWEDAVRTLGGNRLQVLLHVVVPGALPGILSGLTVGIGVSWVCLISAEMISGQYGVGYRTWLAYTLVNYPGVIAGMMTIGVLGWGTSALVGWFGRQVTAWLPRQERR